MSACPAGEGNCTPPKKPTASEAQRIHRALRTLSAGNRSLLRAVDEQELLQEMCRVIVEEGGYAMAWVGYAQHDAAKTIRPMAFVGTGEGPMGPLHLTWADTQNGQRAPGVAIRTGRPSIRRSIPTDPAYASVRDEALQRGYGASSAFPLLVDGQVIGNLSINATESDAFDEAELRLLGELADDLGYGIANLRTRIRHREAERTIERMAFYDALTGLPNRVLLRERLDAAIQRARQQHHPLSLLALDLGHFREINDALGYREGDHLLEEISTRVAAVVNASETVARLADDELAILLPEGGADYASELARRLLRALQAPIELAGLAVDARTSIGIALFPGHGTDPDVLIRRANMAAFQARRTTAGYAIFAGSLDRECSRRLALMGDLRRAIDNRELLLYYQPKVHIASGRICGAEALVRWPHPQHGMLPTSEFIKLAEQAGLIPSLTHWVLDAAFSQSFAWHEAGTERPLSVNLSAYDLRDPTLLDRIRGLFATWGTPPQLIQFELTESALMEDPVGALETLGRLKQLDVELSIDDFGTGYSSLSYLQKLPVDSIKIDQSFVANMLSDNDSAIIVRSTIDLGHNLHLGVIAEGVESEALWERLASLGCDTAQGYYVSMPLPAAQFQEWEDRSRWHGDTPSQSS